jgi:hypothetical protein
MAAFNCDAIAPEVTVEHKKPIVGNREESEYCCFPTRTVCLQLNHPELEVQQTRVSTHLYHGE